MCQIVGNTKDELERLALAYSWRCPEPLDETRRATIVPLYPLHPLNCHYRQPYPQLAGVGGLCSASRGV
jgi:hypothetical protein